MKFKSILKFHRFLGLICFPFIILMASTGMVLNHTDDFKLSRIELRWNWLMSWYDMEKPKDLLVFSENNKIITQIGKRIYLNSKEILTSEQPLIAIKAYKEEIFIILKNKALIITPEGDLIEKIENHHGFPTPVDKCGIMDRSTLIIQSNDELFICDSDNLEFKTQTHSKGIKWITADINPNQISQELLNNYSGKGINAHKLITDLHNGFFFTSFGKYLLDIIGLLFIFLSGTGLWVYLAKSKNI
jgi:hypothetical protein